MITVQANRLKLVGHEESPASDQREGEGEPTGFERTGAEDSRSRAEPKGTRAVSLHSDHTGIDLESEFFRALLAEEEELQGLHVMPGSQARTGLEGVGKPIPAVPLIPQCRYPLRSRGGLSTHKSWDV